MKTARTLVGCIGLSGERRVLVGFAPASLLHELSFADTLDEDSGRGYQRRFNPQHSLDFRRYIQQPQSSTIPLTFNIRPGDAPDDWKLTEDGAAARLEIRRAGKVLSQVDCQHRLGYLNDVSVSLPFMCYLGLTAREEMEVFNTINTKAKGLSTSLLDFHEATLSTDLASERPELFIALHLNSVPHSPWFRQLDLGGNATSGLMRRASLRTMQKAVKRFLVQTKILRTSSPEMAARIVLDFWSAVAIVFKSEWETPRRHLLNKGVGVYALMSLAADIFQEAGNASTCDKRHFTGALSDLAPKLDWGVEGTFKGLGGEAGVKAAITHMREARRGRALRLVHG